MRPKGNGLIPLHDEKQEERGFFCIKLVQFLNTEAEMGTDEYKRLWDERFSAAKIGGIDSNRTALFVFNNGQIYRGCTDGEVDDDGDFCLSKKDTHHRIGLPFDRLLGWAYEKEG